MSRPIKRATSTDCTTSYWLTVRKFGIGIPLSGIDRGVAIMSRHAAPVMPPM